MSGRCWLFALIHLQCNSSKATNGLGQLNIMERKNDPREAELVALAHKLNK